jgi:hypothetical protein
MVITNHMVILAMTDAVLWEDADVSEEHTASIFNVEVCRLVQQNVWLCSQVARNMLIGARRGSEFLLVSAKCMAVNSSTKEF